MNESRLELNMASMLALVLTTLNTSYTVATALAHQVSALHLSILSTSLVLATLGLLYCCWSVVHQLLGHPVTLAHTWVVRFTTSIWLGLGLGAAIGVAGSTTKWF